MKCQKEKNTVEEEIDEEIYSQEHFSRLNN